MSKRISELDTASALTGEEDFVVVQSSQSKKVKLGTAASKNVTTSAIDTTAGGLLKNGDHGIGGYITGSADANSLTTPGIYTLWSTALNNPTAFGAIVIVGGYAANRLTQTLITVEVTTPQMFFRAYTGEFSPWREVYHSGNALLTQGTFTPALTFGGLSTGIIYTSQGGHYTKKLIGGGLSEVFAQIYITLSNKGTATGNANFSLPFSVYAPAASGFPVAALRFSGVTYSGQFMGYGENGLARISLEQTTEAGVRTNLTNANFANSSALMYGITYLTQD